MKFKIAQIIGMIVIILPLQACVSTSLQDAAPTSLADIPEPTPLNVTSPQVLPATTAPNQALVGDVVASNDASGVSTQAIVTQKTETVIPPPRTDETFPTFAKDPSGAIPQLTNVEKAAIEARMTQLLLLRENDPRIKAKYQARLKSLRQIARSHAADAEADIQQ